MLKKFLSFALAATTLFAGCERNSDEPDTPDPPTPDQPQSEESFITAFAFREAASPVVDIRETAGQTPVITVYVPQGTNLRSLTPDITHSAETIAPPSGTTQDFSTEKTYTLTAADGTEKIYTVRAAYGSSDKEITSFGFADEPLFSASPDGAQIKLFIPYADITRFTPAIAFKGYSISPDTTEAVDFTKPVTYTVRATDGSVIAYKVSVECSRLPVMLVNTPDAQPVDSREIWVREADWRLYDGERQQQQGLTLAGKLDIKGRGNTTWNLEKKPYTIELAKGEKAPLCGMPAHRRWTLIANQMDRSLMRNAVALRMGQILNGMPWTPRSQFIELYLNGEYRGVYDLCEQIRIDGDRVDVPTISNEKPDGGYIIELVNSLVDKDGLWFRTHRTRTGDYRPYDETTDPEALPSEIIGVNLKDPDGKAGELTEVFDRIRNDVRAAEAAIYADDFADPETGYRSWFDVDAAVDFYLVNEIAKNPDADHGSVYLYYDPETAKFVFGPVWDFDLTLGNYYIASVAEPTGWLVKNESYWLPQIIADSYFASQIKKRWSEKKSEIGALLRFIDSEASYLEEAQQRNFERWKKSDIYMGAPSKGSFAAEVEYLRSTLEARLQWIDENIAEF
jgi:hypothetical protein